MSDITVAEKRQHINWLTALVFGLFHIGGIAALFFFSWANLASAALLYWISLSFGIGMGYHRLLTHRSYKVPKPIEYFLTVCATLALEGGPIFWVATHRVHHQNSDKHGDPHSPRDGAWWSHVLWIIFGQASHADNRNLLRYVPDMAKDPFYVWLSKYHYVPLVVVSLILLAVGGWTMVLWGTCLRVSLGLHSTWAVNSATHMWGSKRFSTTDDSRNNWWVALLTFGEGWHNNHHAKPNSARHGLAWYELDVTWLTIRALQSVGLAKAVKVASVHEAKAYVEREAA